MFIFDDETKDENRKQVYDHPLGGKVRFMKYGKKLYANVKDYFKPYRDNKIEKIKKLIPVKWRENLEKVWIDVEAFNKICKNLSEKEPDSVETPRPQESIDKKTKETAKNGRSNQKKRIRKGRRKNRRNKVRQD